MGIDESHGIGLPLSHPSPSQWNTFAPAPHEMILTLRVVPSLLLPEDVRTELQLKVFDMDDRWIIHSNDTWRSTFKAILIPINICCHRCTSQACHPFPTAKNKWLDCPDLLCGKPPPIRHAAVRMPEQMKIRLIILTMNFMIMLTISHCTLSTQQSDYVMT